MSAPAGTASTPQRIVPCVGAVVCDDRRRVLWIRRRDNGLWALPTGRMEPGERLVEAVVRELHEETGLHVRVERLTGLYSSPDTQVLAYPDGRVEHFVTACFLCAPVGGTLAPQPEEVSDLRFRDAALLPEPRVAAHVEWMNAALTGAEPVVN